MLGWQAGTVRFVFRVGIVRVSSKFTGSCFVWV